MNSSHKDILRNNHCALLKTIQNVEPVVNLLEQWGILNQQCKANILEREHIQMDCNRALVMTLPRCGPQAFDLFCQAMHGCSEHEAVKRLSYEEDQTQLSPQELRCHLDFGEDVNVTAKTWNGELCIHIRKFETYPNDRSYPTKRGTVFRLKQWLELPWDILKIEEAIKEGTKETSSHLGANLYASLDESGVTIQQWKWDVNSDSLVTDSKGILLSMNQWKKLSWCIEVMPDFVPELKEMVPCLMQEDHQNQMGYLLCYFCNPNDSAMWNQ